MRPPPAAAAGLAPHVRMTFDAARGQHVLLSPETVWVLNDTGADDRRSCATAGGPWPRSWPSCRGGTTTSPTATSDAS